MASIRRRGHSWQVRVHRKGNKPQVGSFPSKAEATRWGRDQEYALDAQTGTGKLPLENITFGDLLGRYSQAVTPTKRGATWSR